MEEVIDKRLQVAGWLVFGLCVIYAIWLVISAVIASQTTGLLYIKSADSKASLVVSQNGSQAVSAGFGSAKVRLKPGIYQVSAIENGKQTNATVQVDKKRSVTSRLGPVQPVRLPSVAAIDFRGTNELLSYGITPNQINDMEEDFFSFKPRAQTITIDKSSIQTGFRDPRTDGDKPFTINFDVDVDSSSYKATITYTDINTLDLKLLTQSGKEAYDSADFL